MRRRQVATSSSPEAAHELTVVWAGGDRHRVAVRGHELLVDQPCSDGGDDAGPTPVELFIASLASCIAHYARRGLGPSGGGPVVHGTWTMSSVAPWRVASIDLDVRLPHGTSPARLAAVERAISHCTVHNTLLDLPMIRITTVVPALALAGRS
jgi:putative redox protein